MAHHHWQAVIERDSGQQRNGKGVYQYVLLGYSPHEGILKGDLVVEPGAIYPLPIYTVEELRKLGGLDEEIVGYIEFMLDKAPLVLELQNWWKRKARRYRKS